jgi:hypothetical protein
MHFSLVALDDEMLLSSIVLTNSHSAQIYGPEKTKINFQTISFSYFFGTACLHDCTFSNPEACR